MDAVMMNQTMSLKSLLPTWLVRALLICAGLLGAGLRLSFGEESLEVELFRATSLGDPAKVKALLDLGANVNAYPGKGKGGITPLMEAVQEGHDEIARLLIDHGVNLNSRDTRGALWWATSKGNFAIASLLLDRGVDGGTALVEASEKGDLRALSFLLDRKVNVDIEDANGQTPLMGAACKGQTEAIKLLLARGANVNYLNQKHGQTALMYGANPGGTLEAVKLLVENGAAPNAKGVQGWTALMIAAANGHSDMVKFLLARGAKKDVKNASGQTALGVAVMEGKKETADLLRK